jgi:hypothetical protein
MKDQLAKALEDQGGEALGASTDRILEAAFFRRAPLQAGTLPIGTARVVRLDERRLAGRAGRGPATTR